MFYCIYRVQINALPRRVAHQPVDHLPAMTDQAIYDRYRLTRDQIYELTESINDDLIHSDYEGRALHPVEQVCATIRYLAFGDMQRTIGDTLNISQGQISRVIRIVSAAIARKSRQYIYMPTKDERGEIKQHFFREHQIPGVVGVVDGTHIRIQRPHDFEYSYVNRRNYHSINCQMVVDSNYLIRNVVER